MSIAAALAEKVHQNTVEFEKAVAKLRAKMQDIGPALSAIFAEQHCPGCVCRTRRVRPTPQPSKR